MPLDDTDMKLLDIVQDDLPLTSEPYREIASLLDMSADDVILRLKRMKDDGIIRRMGAIFDSGKLGYRSTLCAMKVPNQRVDEVARIVNVYPGVTHNYLRDTICSSQFSVFRNSENSKLKTQNYNMWFTVTARSQQELGRIMAEIREKSGIQDLIDLPAIRVFKIKVYFSTFGTGHSMLDAPPSLPPACGDPSGMVTGLEKRIVRELQEDMPICQRPFESIARKLGMEEEELLAMARELKGRRVIRRFSAVLRHRNLGISANAMGVWCVPEEEVEGIGARMAAFPQVSHCYQRLIRPDWPYNLYTMIHGKAVEDCERVADLIISQDTCIRDYRLLYSTRELKKISMRYFTEGKF